MKYRYRTDEEMKDSGVEWIGKIPNSWNIIKGKYLFLNSKIKNTGKIDNLLSLTLKGVVDRDINNVEGLQPENFDGYQEFYPDNLVFKLIDLENISTSRVGYVHKKGLMSPAYIRLEKIQDIYTKFYYYNYFCYYKKNIFNFLGSVGVRSSLNSSDLLEMNVVANEKKEQEIIANFLDEKISQFDSIISKKEALIEKLEEAKKSLISEVVTGKVKVVKTEEGYDVAQRKPEEMKDSGVEWVKNIPKHWNVVNGRRLFSQRKDKAFENDEQLTASQKYGVILQKEFMELENQKVVLVDKNFSILKHVEPNDFVISMRSFQGGLEYSTIRGCISSAYVMLIPNEKVYAPFFRWFFKSEQYINALQSTSNLVRDGQAMRFSNFVQIPIFELSKKEQQEIAEYLDFSVNNINKLLDKINCEIQKLKEAKQSLITEAVTGKIEILD